MKRQLLKFACVLLNSGALAGAVSAATGPTITGSLALDGIGNEFTVSNTFTSNTTFSDEFYFLTTSPVTGITISGSFFEQFDGLLIKQIGTGTRFDSSCAFFSGACNTDSFGTGVFDLVPGTYTFTINGTAAGGFGADAGYDVTVSAVPLPAAAWLFGSAIVGLFAWNRRNHRVGWHRPAV